MKREEARVTINRWSARGCGIMERGALGDRCELDDPVSEPACVATLTTAYERRELRRRSGPYRGERLTAGTFAGVWEFEAGSVKPFATETREFVVPGSEVVEDCRKCGARGSYRCDECAGAGRLQCWSCKGRPVSRCPSCDGAGGSRCNWCDGRGSSTCSLCGGRGSTSYMDTDGYRRGDLYYAGVQFQSVINGAPKSPAADTIEGGFEMGRVFRVIMAVGSICFFTLAGWVVMAFINLTYMNAPDTIPPAHKLLFQVAGPTGFGIGALVALLILGWRPWKRKEAKG